MSIENVLTLREITKENFRDISKLAVAPEQSEYVASNVFSIAEANFHPEAWFRAIYAEDTPVGFVMIEDWTQVPESDPELPICLWRFMIDKNFQGMGYGRKSLDLVIQRVRTRAHPGYLLTSWVPGEHSPAEFYIKFGFVPTGEELDGEIVARYNL